MTDLDFIFNTLQEKGVVIINENLSNEELLALGNKLGTVVPDDNGLYIHDVLARDQQQGTKGSFSYTCGYGEFPYHTDAAFWEHPARYLILKVAQKSDCKTYYTRFENVITNSRNDLRSDIDRAVFILKTFIGQQFVPFRFCIEGDFGYRYDPNILFPYNSAAKRLVSAFEEILPLICAVEIEWTGSNFAIIDNWKGIHARGSAECDKRRILNRIYIK